MQEVTREQEGVIARLALTHGRVEVKLRDDGSVRVVAAGRSMYFDADGTRLAPPALDVDFANVSIPLDLLRRVLGDGKVAEALRMAAVESDADRVEYYLGGYLGPAVREALEASCAQGSAHG